MGEKGQKGARKEEEVDLCNYGVNHWMISQAKMHALLSHLPPNGHGHSKATLEWSHASEAEKHKETVTFVCTKTTGPTAASGERSNSSPGFDISWNISIDVARDPSQMYAIGS